MKAEANDRGRDEIGVRLHHINNMLCSIRLHANHLKLDPLRRKAADDILAASHEIETQTMELASLILKDRAIQGK